MSRQPLTPPAEPLPVDERMRPEPRADHHAAPTCIDDNTAAGMALSQEESMYLTPASSPTTVRPDEKEGAAAAPTDDEMEEDTEKHAHLPRLGQEQALLPTELDQPKLVDIDATVVAGTASDPPSRHEPDDAMPMDDPDNIPRGSMSSPSRACSTRCAQDAHLPSTLAKVDISLDRNRTVPAWDFTDKRPRMKTPSSLFQPYSKYIGTQQSDRQTYNVEVTILTVDMAQSTMSGYLLIRGLTPEHPMLQTFFTGEIVGGPNQRYSFQTKDPAWGATDKVDLQHWLRFPPWRQLTSYAKRDMNFDFPLDDESWSTQEHIYMRWKEHFLVPDYKQSNIQGASFEGFYYICLNQIEGKISGVYFHSKSEKYQQLELTHVTKKGLGIFGTSPLVELR